MSILVPGQGDRAPKWTLFRHASQALNRPCSQTILLGKAGPDYGEIDDAINLELVLQKFVTESKYSGK